MVIQIGMPCDPDYLCHGIGWGLAVIVLLLVIGLVRIIFKEARGVKKKTVRSPDKKIPPKDGIQTNKNNR